MKNVYKDPIETIHQAIKAGDYDVLSDALDLAYNSGGRSAVVKSAICFGYRVLADVWKDSPVETLISNERMRQLFRSEADIYKNELKFLHSYFEIHSVELGTKSIELIRKMTELIRNDVPPSFKKKPDIISASVVSSLPVPKDKVEQSHILFHQVQTMAKYLFIEITDKVEGDTSVEYYCSDCQFFYFDGVYDYSSGYLQLAYHKTKKYCPECGTSSERYITQQEFADRTSLSINTVRKWSQTSKIRKVYFGRSVRIPESEIEQIARHIPSIYD